MNSYPVACIEKVSLPIVDSVTGRKLCFMFVFYLFYPNLNRLGIIYL